MTWYKVWDIVIAFYNSDINKIAIDSYEMYDKPQNSPVQLSYPKNLTQIKYLLKCIFWVRTEEAKICSHRFIHEKWRLEYE